jgi:hypothetical protein
MQKLISNDILIIGDSYAFCRDKLTDWPKYLCYLLTNTESIPPGQGFAGCAWWSVRKYLLNSLKQIKNPVKILIICHTSADRLPSDADLSLTHNPSKAGAVFCSRTKSWITNLELANAAELYYKHLYFKEFYDWARLRWFEELDDLLEIQKIPLVIHIPCFQNGSHLFRNGINVSGSLFDHSIQDDSQARNHFTDENNVKLAEFLFKLINSGVTSGVHKLRL